MVRTNVYNYLVRIDRELATLGQAFYPFREGNNRIQIALVPNAQPIPIDFKIQPVNHSSLNNAGFLVCEGTQLLHPLALTIKQVDGSQVYLDPSSRLDLAIQIPEMPVITGKIRHGLYEERKLGWWYYDPSLLTPRLKTQHFLPPPLPALATPGFLGSDSHYRVGESFGGKLVVNNCLEALADIEVKFSLTDLATLPKILAAKRELWEDAWNNFNWERFYGSTPEKGLVKMYESLANSGFLDPQIAEAILQTIGIEPSRSAEELIAQAEEVRASAQRWIIKRRAKLYKIFREQEDRFRM